MSSFNTTELCSHHSHPQANQPVDHITGTDHHCATEKQPAKTDHLNVACFACEI